MKTGGVRWGVVMPLILAAVGLFFGLLHREQHHWDEFAYVYGAAHYSPAQLAHGAFEDSNISGFYNLKIGHVILLHGLLKYTGDGLAALQTIQGIYILLILAASIFLAWFAALLWGNANQAIAIGLLALLMPCSVYLAPKFLAEVPGFFFVSLSLLFFALALCAHRSRIGIMYGLLSAFALACGFLSRQNAVLLALGAWAGCLTTQPTGRSRKKILRIIMVIAVGTVVLLTLLDVIWHLDLLGVLKIADSVMSIHISHKEVLKRALYALGPAVVIVPFAFMGSDKKRAVFYGTWFAIGMLPLALLRLHYMEERFMVTAVPGFAGLVVLGGETVWRWARAPRHWLVRGAAIVAVAAVFACANGVIQPKTRQEVDTQAYQQVMDYIERAYPKSPILIPWHMSDYHYLRVAYPDAPVYLVNSSTFFRKTTYTTNAGQWVVMLRQWFGSRAVLSLDDLRKLGPSPWVLLSWEVPGWDTLRFSWVRDEARLKRVLVYRSGRYTVYEVNLK